MESFDITILAGIAILFSRVIFASLTIQINPDTTDMVLCVLPNNRKDRYDTIKKFVCVEKPVPSQMVIGKTISKPDLLTAVATKIAIQINCKLGGETKMDAVGQCMVFCIDARMPNCSMSIP